MRASDSTLQSAPCTKHEHPARGTSTLHQAPHTSTLHAAPDTLHPRLSLAILACALLLNFWLLAPEVHPALPLNDGVLHLGLMTRAAETLGTSESILDHWNSNWVLGFPVFEYYQHLPHIAVALIERALGQRIERATLYNLCFYLVLAVFPAAIYAGLRLIEFSPLAAAFAALCAPLLSSSAIGGFDYQSYVWRGSGMFTQAWGMSLFPLALGAAWHTMRTGKGAGWAVAALAITMVSHVMYGYMAVLSIVILAFVPSLDARPGRRASMDGDRDGLPAASPAVLSGGYLGGVIRRGIRSGFILGLTAIAIAYFLLPRALNGIALSRSIWIPAETYDSYGMSWVLRALVTGDLLDRNRLPILTGLASVGLAHALVRRRAADRVAWVLFSVWLLLYFGRPTWGALYRLLPLNSDLHLQRFIGGVHFAAIALAGLGLEQLFIAGAGSRSLRTDSSTPLRTVVASSAIALALLPAALERNEYMTIDASMIDRNKASFAEANDELNTVFSRLRESTRTVPARVFAGLPGTWGAQAAVGNVPMYALLSLNGFDILGYAYHAMSFGADVQYQFNDHEALHYEIFNVGWVVAPRTWVPPSFLVDTFESPHWIVYRAPTQGFFALADAPIVWRERPHDVYAAAVASLPSSGLSFAAHAGASRATAAGPSSYRASVDAAQPGHLVFKMTHHPWWRASVDGQPQPLEWVAPGFMAVSVPAGSHQVAFDYTVPSYKRWLVPFGMILLVGCVLFGDRSLERVERLARFATRGRSTESLLPETDRA